MNIIKKSISKTDSYSFAKDPIQVEPNTMYQVSFDLSIISGTPYSAYVFAILLDSSMKKELGRKIKWIREVPITKKFTIIFDSGKTSYVSIGFRVNKKSPVKGNLDFEINDPNSIKLQKSESENEDFDDLHDYEVPYIELLTNLEENTFEKNLVWLVGSGRSGTTWLGARLLKHSEINIWYEPRIGRHFSQLTIEGRETGNPQFSTPFERMRNNPDYLLSKQFKHNWIPALKKFILTRAHCQIQDINHSLIVKEPTAARCSDILLECFPNSKLLFLIRDGRNVVASELDMHQNKSWSVTRGRSLNELDTSEKRMRMIKFYASMWKTENELAWSAYNNWNQNLCHIIRYEDLKNNTFEELKKIYSFLNVTVSEKELQQIIDKYDFNKIPASERGEGKFYRAAADSHEWKKNFTPEEQEVLNDMLRDTLEKFQYFV